MQGKKIFALPTRVLIACLAAGVLGTAGAAFADSPPMAHWVDALPVPPVAQAFHKPFVSLWADRYEITMSASQHQFNSSLGPATVWTYGQPGKTPVLMGPTIVAKKDRPVIITYINNLPTDRESFPFKDAIDDTIPGFDIPTGAAIPHFHGGHTAARYDGTPNQWWTADGQQGMDYVTSTFTYMNDQPAALYWYHDHTMGATRLKPYLGLAAGYLILDDVDNGATILGQKVPSGYGKYHLPIVLQDKEFNADGTLFYPTEGISDVHPKWVPEFFGDTPVINGKAYPFLDAQPRRYRLRLLNGSQARFYNLHLQLDGRDLPFWVIGSDSGLLPAPAQTATLLIAPGERFDVIADFTGIPLGSVVMMTNDAQAPYPFGDPENDLPELMRINISAPVPANDPDDTVSPAALRLPEVTRLAPTPNLAAREFVLKETMNDEEAPLHVYINGLGFEEPTTEFVKAGSTETWQWINLTGDAHPMHTHLVSFQVVNRQKFDVERYDADWAAYLASGRSAALKPVLDDYLIGEPLPPAPEEMGFKDTVKAYPSLDPEEETYSFVTRIIAKFDLPVLSKMDHNRKTKSYGKWVYHCHILEHEENEMMRPFEVVE